MVAGSKFLRKNSLNVKIFVSDLQCYIYVRVTGEYADQFYMEICKFFPFLFYI